MSSEERGRASYLDLLINTLMEHEKNLDKLIDRLEKIYKNLQEIREKGEEEKAKKRPAPKEEAKPEPEELPTLIYMKIKPGRSIEDIKKIIESLKE